MRNSVAAFVLGLIGFSLLDMLLSNLNLYIPLILETLYVNLCRQPLHEVTQDDLNSVFLQNMVL